MAEELDKYLRNLGITSTYIHSEVKTLDRVEILERLRNGFIDVLVGVNLLREGLDLPEVSLVAIMDADKEGFLRSERSLVQTIGRAARNVRGKVVMYADEITESMRKTIEETNRRRTKQMNYNLEHGIVPETIQRDKTSVFKTAGSGNYQQAVKTALAADPIVQFMDAKALDKAIEATKSSMLKAAKELDFIDAARLRDELSVLEEKRKNIE
jgi:excinuclease ABC subunit B